MQIQWMSPPKATRKPLKAGPNVSSHPVSAHPSAMATLPSVPRGGMASFVPLRFGMNIRNYLSQVASARMAEYQAIPTELSFEAYLEATEKEPQKHLRTTSQYIADALEKYTAAEIDDKGDRLKSFELPKESWFPQELHDSGVIGQERTLNQVYKTLRNFETQLHPDRMIVLYGPNGSGKGITVNTLMRLVEAYSKDPTGDGVRYSVSWELSPVEKKETIGYVRDHAGAKEEGISFETETYVNPFFILEPEDRYRFIRQLQEEGKLNAQFNTNYFVSPKNLGLDHTSKWIMAYLKEKYQGDYEQILKHVKVKRYTYQYDLGKGLVELSAQNSLHDRVLTVGSQLNVDALPMNQQIRIPDGHFTRANGGIIALDELLLNLQSYEHLIHTAESGTLNVGDNVRTIRQPMDAVIMGVCNDEDLKAVANNPIFKKLKQRCLFVPVPYILRYKDNARYYTQVFQELKGQPLHAKPSNLAPHTMEAYAAFVTLTYLFPIVASHFQDNTKLKELLEKKQLTLMDKMLLYQGVNDLSQYGVDPKDGTKPKLSAEEYAFLRQHIKDIASEYNKGVGKVVFTPFYEGGIGLDPREAKNYLAEAVRQSKPEECFSVLEMLAALKKEVAQGGLPYEPTWKAYAEGIRQQTGQTNFPNAPVPGSGLLAMVELHYKRKVDTEIRAALGLSTARTHNMVKLTKYIENVRAMQDKEPLEPFHSPLEIPPNMPGEASIQVRGWGYPNDANTQANLTFIREMETNELASTLKSFSGGVAAFREKCLNKTARIKYTPETFTSDMERSFTDELNAMQAKQEEKNKELLEHFKQDIKEYYQDAALFERKMTVSPETQERAQRMAKALDTLEHQCGYCAQCLPKLLPWALGLSK